MLSLLLVLSVQGTTYAQMTPKYTDQAVRVPQRMSGIKLWPDCIVKYRFPEKLQYLNETYSVTSAWLKAVSFIEDNTMVRFVVADNQEEDYVVFSFSGHNDGAGLRKRWEPNNINLYEYGYSGHGIFKGVLYSLGFYGEINRGDRDKYVEFDITSMDNSTSCQRHYTMYYDYPPVELDFDFDSVMFHNVKYCANCYECSVVKPKLKHATLRSYFEDLYGKKRYDDPSEEEYRHEIPRIEAFYPYSKCYNAQLTNWNH